MEVRRVDFWNVKSGRHQDFINDFNTFVDVNKKLSTFGHNIRLVMAGVNGQSPSFTHYWFGDWDSMEAYGAFIDEARANEEQQRHWMGFHGDNSPVVHAGTSILTKMAEFGAPTPAKAGATAIVRTWRVKPGHYQTLLDGGKQMEPHWKKFDGHSEAWRAEFAGPFAGSIITSTAFPDAATLGKWMDYASSSDEVQQTVSELRRADSAPEPLASGIATVIAL